MPRGNQADILSHLRAQAARALDLLEREIDRREAEIRDMVSQLDGWRAFVNGGPRLGPRGRPAVAAGGWARSQGGQRVNWDKVLASVPKKFGVEDIMKDPGAAAKGRAQAYPALNRWETSGRIKRIEKGRYERVGASKRKAARGRRPVKKK
ncbi:MAG TPA: hypothetical protein VFC51_12275 [Chloroflexota bacterium]|nr:hypothetical protein [Chloroflexota bacterium]